MMERIRSGWMGLVGVTQVSLYEELWGIFVLEVEAGLEGRWSGKKSVF